MIITRTPMRVSFCGTDLQPFCDKYGGAVVSCAINRYIYVTASYRDDNKIVASYGQVESVNAVDEIHNPLIRECIRYVGIKNGLEIHIISDISTVGTGLGGSSALTVGLLNALYNLLDRNLHKELLAKMACHIEIGVLKKTIGKQDQYACALGWINQLRFNTDNSVSIDILNPDIFISKLYLLNMTGQRMPAEGIIKHQIDNIDSIEPILTKMKNQCALMSGHINILDTIKVIEILNESWQLKKQLSNYISSEPIDNMINEATRLGCGAKLCGAGQSGFIAIVAKDDDVPTGSIPVSIDTEGTKVIYPQE